MAIEEVTKIPALIKRLSGLLEGHFGDLREAVDKMSGESFTPEGTAIKTVDRVTFLKRKLLIKYFAFDAEGLTSRNYTSSGGLKGRIIL